MNIRSALIEAAQRLSDTSNPRLDAETLLMHVLQRERSYLYAHPEFELACGELTRYYDAVLQRAHGIPLQYIWAIVWAVAGFVALVAGLMWGARNGVQYALTFTALKALPVLILGGFESIPGAIVGGLIVGASEKLAEVYIGPHVGGGIEGWFPYVLALLFLLVRPEGLFGEKRIDRV